MFVCVCAFAQWEIFLLNCKTIDDVQLYISVPNKRANAQWDSESNYHTISYEPIVYTNTFKSDFNMEMNRVL